MVICSLCCEIWRCCEIGFSCVPIVMQAAQANRELERRVRELNGMQQNWHD